MKYICVFCGTSDFGALKYAELARTLGKALVAHGYGLVFGGANAGLMKMLADTVWQAGGEIVGVVTPEIKNAGVVHADIKAENLFVETSYAARKTKMSVLSEGFIALPGGLGTLDELMEVAIYNQFAHFLNMPDNPVKPVAVVNVNGFYAGLQNQLTHCMQEKFMTQAHLEMLLFTDDALTAVNHVVQFDKPVYDKTRWWEVAEAK